MLSLAAHVGYRQASVEMVDEAWESMLKALKASADAATDGGEGEGGRVTPESWIARASALALCARDSGAESDAAMTR